MDDARHRRPYRRRPLGRRSGPCSTREEGFSPTLWVDCWSPGMERPRKESTFLHRILSALVSQKLPSSTTTVLLMLSDTHFGVEQPIQHTCLIMLPSLGKEATAHSYSWALRTTTSSGQSAATHRHEIKIGCRWDMPLRPLHVSTATILP